MQVAAASPTTFFNEIKKKLKIEVYRIMYKCVCTKIFIDKISIKLVSVLYYITTKETPEEDFSFNLITYFQLEVI